MRDGMPPYPAVARQEISQMDLSRVQPGGSIIVKVNTESPAAVWADLTRIP